MGTTLQKKAAPLRTTLITIALSATLAACGGSSSSNSSGGSLHPALPLDDTSRGLAVRTATYDLWQIVLSQRWLAIDAFGWLADRCEGSINLQETDTDSSHITFTRCNTADFDSDGDSQTENTLTANGTVSRHQDQDTGLATNVFTTYSFLELGKYRQKQENNGATDIYQTSWEYGAAADGSITFSDSRNHFFTDRLSLRLTDNFIEELNGAEYDSGVFQADYVISDLQIDSTADVDSSHNSHTGSGHIVRTLEEGTLTISFDIITPLTRTFANYPCFNSGELHLADAQGNDLSILFSSAEVTFTLNGVADTISCDAFAEEIDLERPIID